MGVVIAGLIAVLADPVVVALLLAMGVVALLFQIGGVAPMGLMGAACLALAALGVAQLPIGPVTAMMTVAVGVAAGLIAAAAARSRRRALAPAGPPLPSPLSTVIRHAGDGAYVTFVEGAWWTVLSRTGPLDEGMTVEVVGREGIRLIVVPKEDQS